MAVLKNTSKDSGKAVKGSINLELKNDCQNYVAPWGDIYKSGKVYTFNTSAEVEKASKLLSFKDDKGIRYFYEVTQESLIKRKRAKQAAVMKMAEQMVEEGLVKVDEDGELDTGSMRLEDSEGNSVGKVEV